MGSPQPVPSDPDDAQARLAARYPDRSGGRLWWWVSFSLLVIAVIGFFIWTRSEPSASGEVLAYEQLSQTQLQADVLIRKPADAAATCTVVALDRSTSIVGSTQAQAGPGRPEVTVRVVIETLQPASVAQIGDCALA